MAEGKGGSICNRIVIPDEDSSVVDVILPRDTDDASVSRGEVDSGKNVSIHDGRKNSTVTYIPEYSILDPLVGANVRFSHLKSSKPSPKLKDLMLYRTIQFMDYRRLLRRFNGIRKPVSNKKALFICLFCILLALVPFVYLEVEKEHYIVGVQIQRGIIPYFSSATFVIGAFLLARIQLSVPLKWPVAISYLFMFSTLIVLTVLKNIINVDKFIWLTLIIYTAVQVTVILITKIVIRLCPLLALNGMFFPCTEHFHLLQRSQRGERLNITISRYNDYSVMCGSNMCGICLCAYRTSYRWLRWCYRKYKVRVLGNTYKKGRAPFSHQMRYNGEVDDNSLPHGYGEWLEDHTYGERLQGYWWHGYPIGPFSSQELGSGSIFTNTRVAFVTDTRSSPGNARYGVASTECSMSGNFFREFPLTYFFNPMYNKNKDPPQGLCSDVHFFSVMSEDPSGLPGASVKWCIRMLKSQFYLNMPNSEGYMNIYVDKITNSLRIEGYRRIKRKGQTDHCDEITIKLNTKRSSRSARPEHAITGVRRPTGGVLQLKRRQRLSRPSVGLPTVDRLALGDQEEILPSQKSSRPWSSYSNVFVRNANTPVGPSNENRYGEIAHLFLDEENWESRRTAHYSQIQAKGWMPIRSFGRLGCIAEQAVIYIHGYNVNLAEACSQLAHIVSFSKLPPYILPFVFNWEGKHWGPFSAFSYPVAKKITQHPNIENSFQELLCELIALDIKHLHLIIHSCGARVFFKVLHGIIAKRLVAPVVSGIDIAQGYCDNEDAMLPIRIDTCILLNPDYSMEKFRDHDYFVLRGYCDHIVMYVDSRDQCLTFSEWYNRETSLGRSVFSMCTSPAELATVLASKFDCSGDIEASREMFAASMSDTYLVSLEDLPYVSTYTMYKNDDLLSQHGKSSENQELQVMNPDVVSETSQNSNCPYAVTCQASYANQLPERRRSGFPTGGRASAGCAHCDSRVNREASESEYKEEEFGYSRDRSLWLDMDVIDTTMIDTNVDFLKHTPYQMKREIMDDLREVILMHTRAEKRQTRLDRRRGNVYVFRVAPAGVGNLFSWG